MDYTEIINRPIEKESRFLERLEYIIIFMMIYLSSSFVINAIPGFIILGGHFACLFLFFIVAMLDGKKFTINSKMAIKLFTLLAIISIGSMSSRGEEAKQAIINILQFFIAYLYALSFDFSKFLKKFVNIIYFICWFSVIVYVLYIVVPDFIKLFPDVSNTVGVKAENLFFTTICGGINVRNQGLFWEPGAFQTYINLTLIMELFYFKNLGLKRMTVYMAAILTTYSTAGYLTTLFIVYIYITQHLFSTSGKEKSNAKTVFIIMTVVIIAIIVFFSLSNNVSESVFGKFDAYRESGYGSNKRTTVSVRFDAFIRPFKVFWQYPMFGAGTRGMTNFALNERYNMNTCTFINWFAYFGIFFGAMMMRMFYKFAKRFSNKKIIVYMIFFAIFLATATENYYRNPSILIFAFFPFVNNAEENNNENLTEHQQL